MQVALPQFQKVQVSLFYIPTPSSQHGAPFRFSHGKENSLARAHFSPSSFTPKQTVTVTLSHRKTAFPVRRGRVRF